MAFVITDSCVSCGSCAGECPVGAISQGDGKYDIDATGYFHYPAINQTIVFDLVYFVD